MCRYLKTKAGVLKTIYMLYPYCGLVEHLEAQVDLLRHDIGDARGVRGVDDRAFLGAEDAMAHGPVQQLRQARNGLHHLHAVDLVLQALVDLEEGDAIECKTKSILPPKISIDCSTKAVISSKEVASAAIT